MLRIRPYSLRFSSTTKRRLATHERAPLFNFTDSGNIEVSRDYLKHITGYKDSAVALRDACRCSKCVDQSTQQREFSFADIPFDIQGDPKLNEDGSWQVKWTNDIPGYADHVSTFSPDQIRRFRSNPRYTHKVPTMLWDAAVFKKETHEVSYEEYMRDDTGIARVLHALSRHGLVFIRGVPCDTEQQLLLAERIAPLRNTFYGSRWDVRSKPQAKNVAYTSKYLGFHMDLMYLKEPPGIQLLHCLENSCTGGESRFVDTFKAYDVMMDEDFKLAKVLRHARIRYEYDNDGQYYSDVKPIIETRHSAEIPNREVLGSPKGNVMGQISRVYWSPPFVASVCAEPKEDPDKIREKIEASKVFAEIFERPELVVEEKMEPGTCVIFNNLRVLHARNEFDINSGKRWLRGCYLDSQDVLSKEFSLSDKIMELNN